MGSYRNLISILVVLALVATGSTLLQHREAESQEEAPRSPELPQASEALHPAHDKLSRLPTMSVKALERGQSLEDLELECVITASEPAYIPVLEEKSANMQLIISDGEQAWIWLSKETEKAENFELKAGSSFRWLVKLDQLAFAGDEKRLSELRKLPTKRPLTATIRVLEGQPEQEPQHPIFYRQLVRTIIGETSLLPL